jgi:hypothetical protein
MAFEKCLILARYGRAGPGWKVPGRGKDGPIEKS